MAKIFYIAGPKVGLTFNGQPITAGSTPVYDEWGWGDYWGCDEWMAWHKELLKVMPPQQAADTWAAAWNKQDSFSGPYNWCKYNQTFREYMRAHGVNIDSIVSAIVMPVFDAAGNLAQGSSNVVTNTTDAVSTISSLAKPIGIALLIGAGWWAYNKYVK